ncbi:MAG: DUF2721 domain-containing protein [Flavisolibacter sp.]|nr:DUF2721 domain-containing protein [Flavisolibacter sp.]MBD0350664.1 DUF2721 domain-containing protein [Flavisolibacter sp.]MBD0364722.1 DUF2721 domain-containing protein [Flavisolibacter sp.]
MELAFSTPALLFPAISLLLLAYTNRFVALASLVRKLHDEYKEGKDTGLVVQQIKNLRQRINLIRYMQGLGVFSFFLCVTTMICIYYNWSGMAELAFVFSLITLMTSLFISLIEIHKSTNALELELSDMQGIEQDHIFSNLWKKNRQ